VEKAQKLDLAARRERTGRIWRLGILVTIVALGAVLMTMIFVRPDHGWAWAMLLVLYTPVILICAALLKYLVLKSRKVR
jgi:hypothetical protein